MENYELLNIYKKNKGIQLHIHEVNRKCIRIVYVDFNTLEPLQSERCPEQLASYLDHHKNQIEMELESVAV